MRYEVVCTEHYLDVGLQLTPNHVLARASKYGKNNEYGGAGTLVWVKTGVFLSRHEWVSITYDKPTEQILKELNISKPEENESENMKYIVDIDALKDCLELTPQCTVNGKTYVSLDIVKEMIDRFPKEGLSQTNG